MRLKGRRVLIVGVSKGLGYALAYFLLKEGASVVINSRNEEKLKEIKKSLESIGEITYVVGDVSTLEKAREVVEKAGNFTDLVVTVGGYIEDTVEDLKALDEMINNHIKIPLYVVHYSLSKLKEGSTIVLVSAIRGIYTAYPTQLSYAVGKAGLAKEVEILASELLSRGIRVVGIAPSFIDGDFVPDRDWKKLRKLGDFKAPPEDFARVIVWLLTEEAEWVNGVVIPVDGGARLKL
ncbi:SDR family NAD(P)-dependent oxidoreductase [Sulfurisphaera tokodaii]|uniref:Oxidoreductase n=2 Tax=Sulfurisphaera tokodaii TaxID=111955 RepID=Q96Y80_SULTO|nr:SDR family NAD(P)-dependent oxidoreductase [Sulfurisphaera tokodaii]BAB67397.1 putative oxidoreductase [Sulfurisphaera tokodaii str. 7]HII75109.1 SDR family oxidoreductase [Sulfurisphaera tokodaii]